MTAAEGPGLAPGSRLCPARSRNNNSTGRQALQGQQQHWQQALQEQQRFSNETLAQQAAAGTTGRVSDRDRAAARTSPPAPGPAASAPPVKRVLPTNSASFHEAREEAAPETAEAETVEVPAHQRAKRGRRHVTGGPATPRVSSMTSAKRKKSARTMAPDLEAMGEDISEQLDIIRGADGSDSGISDRKYACPCCERAGTDRYRCRHSRFPKALPPRACWPMWPAAKYVDCVAPVPAGSDVPAPGRLCHSPGHLCATG